MGEAPDGLAALRVVAALRPDVVLMDVAMPSMDGIAAARQLRVAVPESAVIVVSVFDDAATRREAALAGASAFLGKHEAVTDLLLSTIRAVGQARAS